MRVRPRILFLAHRVPFPPNRGDRIRSFHLLQFLARRADVSLAYLTVESPPRETTESLESLCARVAFARVGRTRWLHAAAALAAGHTATEGLFHSTTLRRTIAGWAAEQRFDAVVAVCSSMAQYLDVPGLAGVPAVVDLVDVDSQKWFDYAHHAWGPKRFLLRLEAKRLRQLESALPVRVEAVTVVADREADVFHTFSPERPHVLRNGVDLDYFRPTPAEHEQPTKDASRLTIVFVGALDYQANVDGARWFCHEVWPAVRRRFRSAVLQLVGSRPNAQARRLGRLPGVELVGEVPDVRPHLRDATVVIVPLRVARGVQNKVLEALAAGKPVVVSPQALEGINATPDVELVRASTADEWTEAICALHRAPQRRQQLGRAGRAFVEKSYRWSTQLATLTELPGLRTCPWSTAEDVSGHPGPNTDASAERGKVKGGERLPR